MKAVLTSRAFVGALVVSSIATLSSAAHAHGGADEPTKDRDASGTVRKEGAHAAGEREHEAQPTVDLSLDAVLGWGKVPAINTGLPGALGLRLQSSVARTPVFVDSYIVGAGFRVGEHVRAFARLPIVHATFSPDEPRDTRGTQNIGNLEIGAGLTAPEDKPIAVLPKLALALPTSSGMPLPPGDEVAAHPDADYDRPSRDTYAMLLAANGSRGYEESALFASKRLGITPSVEIRVHAGKLELVPFAAVAVLISTAKFPEKRVAGDVVAGAEAALPVATFMDFALRAFVNFPFAREERSDSILAIVEPQLRFHAGPVKPYVGVLLPFLPAGTKANDTLEGGAPTFDPRMIGVRLGISAAF